MNDEIGPAEAKRLAPKAALRNTEKALGLEVARLFGLNPRLLMPPSGVASASPEEKGENDDLSGDRPRGGDRQRPEP